VEDQPNAIDASLGTNWLPIMDTYCK